MELNALPYSKGPSQAIIRETPLLGYARHHFSFLIVRDEESTNNAAIVVPPRATQESAIESLIVQTPYHDGQLTRVDFSRCWRSSDLRGSCRLGSFTRARNRSRLGYCCNGWFPVGRGPRRRPPPVLGLVRAGLLVP